MFSKRQLLGESIALLGVAGALKPAHDRGRRRLLVLGYHRVLPSATGADEPLDMDLLSASAEEFDWQMSLVAAHHEVVSLGRLIEHLEGRAVLPQRSVVVTFDDGFLDTYEHAFPILRRTGVPAVVFLTTEYASSGEAFWFERVARLVLGAPPRALALPGSVIRYPRDVSRAARLEGMRALQAALKQMTNARRHEVLAHWEMIGASWPLCGPERMARSMSFEQAATMSRSGIDIGSHTRTHPNLSLLSEEEQLAELSVSKRAIESRVGKEVVAIAYPTGTTDSYDWRTVAAARASGYKLGFTYNLGLNWTDNFSPLEIRRIGISPRHGRGWFQSLVDLPGWVG